MRQSVRLLQVKIDGLLNVEHGVAQMACKYNRELFSQKADVLGIYGPNGSGKTTLIHSLGILQTLLSGRQLAPATIHYLRFGASQAQLSFDIAAESHGRQWRIVYTVVLAKAEGENERPQDHLVLRSERVQYSELREGEWSKLAVLLHVPMSAEGKLAAPAYRAKQLAEIAGKNAAELIVDKLLTSRQGGSFLFSQAVQMKLIAAVPHFPEDGDPAFYLLRLLSGWGRYAFFVIETHGWGQIHTNAMQPFFFRLRHGGRFDEGSIPVALNRPSLLPKQFFHVIMATVQTLNLVIDKIIPGMQVELVKLGEQLDPHGVPGIVAELISVRGDMRIPLRYEAEGVKKLIAILQILIEAYNDPSMTLAIDELDAGIFEYLLGEVLQVFQSGGQGQLIFTSHNLRPLETLAKSALLFTTTNPKNRYIRFANVKTNNNLRDVYFHDIVLGGQKEEIYERTSRFEIAHALRKAGVPHA